MNIRSIIVGLSLATVSGLSQAGDPYYGPYYGPSYGPGAYYQNYYGPSYGPGAYYQNYYGRGHYYAPKAKVEKSVGTEEYWDGPFYEQGSTSPYWVKRSRAKSVPSQGYVENPGRKYVERYAPHAAHHVPKYVPSEKKADSFTQDGKTYFLGADGVYRESGYHDNVYRGDVSNKVVSPKAEPVPQEGKRYYIEDGVYREVVPGASSGVIIESHEDADAARGRSIGEYYRNRYGR